MATDAVYQPRNPEQSPVYGIVAGSLGRACTALHNPWYAGAYAFGRNRVRTQPDGRQRHERLPREQWHVLIRDAHPAYISWQEYERNEQQLQQSGRTFGFERNAGPA